MIGMRFGVFLTLLILGIIAAIVMHYIIRYRMLKGHDGFVTKWVAGWIGAWLGGPVLGHWWFQIQNIYIIPALVGAFVGAFSFAALFKAYASAHASTMAPKAVPDAPAEMLRRAS